MFREQRQPKEKKKKITHVRLRSIAAFKEDKPTKDWINTDMSCKTEKTEREKEKEGGKEEGSGGERESAKEPREKSL